MTDIPYDYYGAMGVPITYLDKHNPDQFEIIALGIVGSIEFTNERKMEILKMVSLLENTLSMLKVLYIANITLKRY